MHAHPHVIRRIAVAMDDPAEPAGTFIRTQPMTVLEQSSAPDATAADADTIAARAGPYVARMLIKHLAAAPEQRTWTSEGTAAFIDISGFTRLSEALARKGRVGAEQVSDSIGHVFESMLAVAYANGGSLLKFGGDALLLWFEDDDHAARACRASVLMRETLAAIGRIDVPDATIALRMSQGVHSGQFNFFAVGVAHRELLPVGPAWSRLVAIQHVAQPDEIAVTDETAAVLPSQCLGERKPDGRLLVAVPPGHVEDLPLRFAAIATEVGTGSCWPRACPRRFASTCRAAACRPSTGR